MPLCHYACACVPVCLCACVSVSLVVCVSLPLFICVSLPLFVSILLPAALFPPLHLHCISICHKFPKGNLWYFSLPCTVFLPFSYLLSAVLLPTFFVSVSTSSFQKETRSVFSLHCSVFYHSQNLILIHYSVPLSGTSFCSLSSVFILETIHFTYLLGEKQITTSFLLETSAVHLSPVKLTASGLLLETCSVRQSTWQNHPLQVYF